MSRKLFLEPLEDRTLPSTLTVLNTGDNGGVNPAVGAGTGTLRQAIIDSNASVGVTDTIAFAIPVNDANHFYYRDDGVAGQVSLAKIVSTAAVDDTTIADIDPDYPHSWWSIKPTSALPDITDPVIIDGYSQPGASQNTLGIGPGSPGHENGDGDNAILRIELDGENIGGSPTGLIISAGNSTVKGLIINRFKDRNQNFTGSAIELNSNGNNHIWGNFIGTDASGTLAPGGLPDYTTALAALNVMHHGVDVVFGSGNNWIGTNGDGVDDSAERNVISATSAGVSLRTFDNVVAGNLIGTDRTGTHALGNWLGIALDRGTHGDRIGTNGTDPDIAGERNIISGNKFGIGPGGSIPSFSDTLVAGNFIGTDVAGTGALGNLVAGVAVAIGSYNSMVGGSSAPLANVIAFNQGPGVWIFNISQDSAVPFGIRVQGNSIHDNNGLGIDLGGDYLFVPPTGPIFDNATPNDSQGHVGPNNWQNFPVLTSASSSSTSTFISGTFSEAAEPNATLTLDFYANANGSSTTYGQGQTYLGSRTVFTDANGTVSFSADVVVGNLDGQWISATSTDSNGNTSEFSLDIQVTNAPDQTFTQGLPAALPQSSTGPNTLTIQANTTSINDVVTAVSPSNLGASVVPVSVYLNLAPGNYSPTTVQVPTGMTLYINGVPGTVIDPVSPAFTVTSGNVVVSNVTFVTTGDAPTILVTGGSLTLRNDTIQESTGFTDAAISVTGGTLDLGTNASPGGNTLNVNGTGEFVHNTSANVVSAVGDTFKVNGTVLTSPSLSSTTLSTSAAGTILNQAVQFTATVRTDTATAGTPAGSVDFLDTTTNTDLGSVPLAGGTALLTTSSLAVGYHVIQTRYSGDATFLPSLDTVVQSVQYKFSGFLPPLNSLQAFAAGRTVPVKFQLTDYNGQFITSLAAVTSLQVVGPSGTISLTSSLRYDPTATQFVVNWQTKGLAAGSYTISVRLADGTLHTITVQLTTAGKPAGLTTDAAGGTAAVAGALLGGNIELYVDNGNGDLTADELARLQDAVTAVDAVTAPYGVLVEEVTDPTLADVTLNIDSTSAVGGYADGVLGCTTDVGQITLITGWNFYAGSDATQIGSTQYDFETLVTHELGHALGLGHSADASSVMNATLGSGAAKRALTIQDLNIPDDDGSGPHGLHATGFRSAAPALVFVSSSPTSPSVAGSARDAVAALFALPIGEIGHQANPFARAPLAESRAQSESSSARGATREGVDSTLGPPVGHRLKATSAPIDVMDAVFAREEWLPDALLSVQGLVTRG